MAAPGRRRVAFGNLGHVAEITKAAAADWSADKAPQLGAALAFYSVLSLAPLVILALSVVSLFFEARVAAEHFLAQVESMVGAEGAKAIAGILQRAHQPKTGAVAAVLGIVTLLLGASGVFGALQDAMNTIWDVPAKKADGWGAFLRRRFLSFTMVLGTGFLLLVCLLLST